VSRSIDSRCPISTRKNVMNVNDMDNSPRDELVPEKLALGRREAAQVLGISQRLLWTYTNQKVIPHLRIGRRVLYPLGLLREWMNAAVHASVHLNARALPGKSCRAKLAELRARSEPVLDGKQNERGAK
jgi:predicted DNA-binding transcriptional regulator AlpA